MAFSKEELQAEMIRREVQKRGLVQDPQAVPDEQAVSESQFISPEQINAQKGAETQQLLGNPNDPNFDPSGLEPWEYQGGIVAGAQRKPGFMKTLDMINTGVHRGVTHFTLGIMSMLPFGQKYQNAIKKVDADIEAEQQKNIKTYDSIAPQVGELGGELLATSPAGGLLGKVMSKGASLVKGGPIIAPEGMLGTALSPGMGSIPSVAVPEGLRALAGYGTSAVGGAGVLSGTEALRYQGDQFDPSKAAATFAENMSNPLSYAMPAAGTAVGRYLDKAQAYNAARAEGIDVMPRDVKEPGLTRKLSQVFMDSVSMINPFSQRVAQLENIGSSIGNVIRKIAGSEEALSTDDYIKLAAKYWKMGGQKLDAQETIAWEKGFKSTPVTNMNEISPLLNEAKNLIQEVKLPTYGRTESLINKNIEEFSPAVTKTVPSKLVDKFGKSFEKVVKTAQKGNITFEDIKNIGSILGDAATDAYNLGAGTGAKVGNELSRIRRDLLDKAAGNLTGESLKDYTAAKTLTKQIYDYQDNIPLFKEALTSEIQANKIIKGIIADELTFDKSKAMEIMATKGQLATKAAKISQALAKASTPDKGVNLSTFLKDVEVPENVAAASQSASATKSLLGPQYDYIQGMAKHLHAMNEAKKIGNMGKVIVPLAAAGALAGGLGAAAYTENLPTVATYGAMLFAANHPMLKKLLGVANKKLSPSMYEHLNNKIQTLFTRGGFMYNEDGSLSEKPTIKR